MKKNHANLQFFENLLNELPCKGFIMIYHSTQSDDFFWCLIFRGKQKEKKTPEYSKFLPIFISRNNKKKKFLLNLIAAVSRLA